MHRSESRLSDDLKRLRDLAAAGPITLGAFLEELNARGHAFVCLVLAFPFLTPIPLPGLSVPFGLMILMVSFCMGIGIPPWVPNGLKQKQVPSDVLVKALNLTLKVLDRVEFLVKPRGQIFVRFPGIGQLSGAAIAFCASLLSLPLPPGTNFPPALGIVLVSLGFLEGDSVVLLLGYLVVALNAALFGSVAVFGFETVLGLWHKIV